jgi:hypothetical protein
MVRFALDLLAKDGALNQVTHRLGVVSFGTTARVDLPLTEVRPAELEAMRSRVDAIRALPTLGHTHFLAALEEAGNLFAGIGPQAAQGASRRRAVVLITDGAPYVEGIDLRAYTAKLREMVSSRFPTPAYSLEVVALNDASSDYWERYRDLWREVSHNQARKLEGDKEAIFAALHEVITALLGNVAARIPPEMYDNLVVPPYLASVVFDVFSVDPGVEVEIYSPADPAVPLRAGSPGVEAVAVGEIIRTLNVRRPQPGLWRIRKSDPEARVEIFSQQFFPRGQLLEPGAGEAVRQHERVGVTYRVMDGDGRPIQELPGYPLALELALVKPDGSRASYAMAPAPQAGPAVFRTAEEVECDQPGSYRTEVLIATKDLNDHPVTVFRDQWSGFTVGAARRIDCHITRPQDNARVPLYRSLLFLPRPIELELRFTDERDQPLNLTAVFAGAPADILKVSARYDGTELHPKVELADRGGGVLRGRVRGLGRPGTYHLKVEPETDSLPGPYSVRVLPPGLTVRRSLAPYHWVELGILTLGALALVGFTGQKLWLSLRFPLRGTLFIDRLGGRQLREYPLASRRNRVLLTDLPVETQIRKLEVQARRDRRGGILITAVGEDKSLLLERRLLRDREQTMLQRVPYVLRYRA